MNPARTCLTALLLGATLFIAGCEAPPPATDQRGYRGQSMGNVANPRTLQRGRPPTRRRRPSPRRILGPAGLDDLPERQGPRRSQRTEFLRVMASMTEWVAPQEESCGYCHNLENMADESKYQYRVARQMLIMTRSLNTTWTSHVGQTASPATPAIAASPSRNTRSSRTADRWARWHGGEPPGPERRPARRSHLAADRPFTELLAYTGRSGRSARPCSGRQHRNIQDTERTYGLMIHMSEGLGVNCTFCHNSNNFGTWSSSPPQRATAYHGIRMVRDININHIAPLQPIQPPERLGRRATMPRCSAPPATSSSRSR